MINLDKTQSASSSLVEVDLEKLSGTPVFYRARVPIQNLFDCLEAGETVDQLLDQFWKNQNWNC